MAGSNLGKLKGVRAKFWADLELVLNKAGPRVESRETRGLFCKVAGTDRYLGSVDLGLVCFGPSDEDRAVQS